MRRRALFLFVSVAMFACASGDGARAIATGRTGVLVELFTSEGCSSCPAADRLLQTLEDSQPIPDADVIALGHHVDYWDALGWRDRFSSAAATNRQQTYARVLSVDAVYTPQMVVDGRAEFVGSDLAAARRTIAAAATAPHAEIGLTLEPAPNGHVAAAIAVAAIPKLSRGDRADLMLAVTESQLKSEVKGGENRGRVLAHAPVVRQLTVVADVAGDGVKHADVAVGQGWDRQHLTVVAFVQERFSRRVLGAASAPLPSAAR